MFCVNCGKEISDEAVFCKYCGHRKNGDLIDSRAIVNITNTLPNNEYQHNFFDKIPGDVKRVILFLAVIALVFFAVYKYAEEDAKKKEAERKRQVEIEMQNRLKDYDFDYQLYEY